MRFHSLRHIILALAATFALTALAQEQATAPVVINVTADSAAVTLGGRTHVHVELLKNSNNGVFIDDMKRAEDASGNQVLSLFGTEVRQLTVDSTDIGNGRVQVNYDYLIQPFDVGTTNLGSFKYALNGDTVFSSLTTIKVLEPVMPQVMRDSLWINPMENVVSIKAKWYDIIPDWWPWALIGAAVIALIALVIILYRKNGPRLLPIKKIIPPHTLALQRLRILKNQKLADNGHIKAYYTELTDILRQYLHGRFGIYAREMTSPQILEACENVEAIKPFIPDFTSLLTTSDFVKFAKQNPGIDENIKSFNIVQNFVDKTIPVEEPADKKKSLRKATHSGKKNKKRRKH